ncbi:hypothetical protein VTJ04DRAFT_10125 [Mycothermus thermophilus]|uniref:uncharacterized protein n=1 Tax=Humicola insolens TaxID=85995 RepID=UPI00374380F8
MTNNSESGGGQANRETKWAGLGRYVAAAACCCGHAGTRGRGGGDGEPDKRAAGKEMRRDGGLRSESVLELTSLRMRGRIRTAFFGWLNEDKTGGGDNDDDDNRWTKGGRRRVK